MTSLFEEVEKVSFSPERAKRLIRFNKRNLPKTKE